jgi:hypothetical protein
LIRSTHPIILFEQWVSEFKKYVFWFNWFTNGLRLFIFYPSESNFYKNKLLRRLKRIPLLLLGRSLNYTLQKIESFEPIEYGIKVAIHQSRVDTDFTFLT